MDELTRFPVPPDGRMVAAPLLEHPERFRYWVEIEGTFRFDYTGQAFDARYVQDTAGRFTQRHQFLRLPSSLRLVHEDPQQHRYRFEVDPTAVGEGSSLAFQIEVDRFVDQYLISPLEVRQQLHGGLTVRILREPVGGGALGWLPLPVVAVALATLWIIRRRQQLRSGSPLTAGLDTDLRERLQALEVRYRLVAAGLRGSSMDLQALAGRCRAIRDAGQELAQRLQRLRAARQGLELAHVEQQVRDLERRISEVESADLRREMEETLKQHRRTLETHRRLQESEERYLLRLSQMESFLERTQLEIPELQEVEGGEDHERRLLAAADEELAVLQEAVRELAGMEGGGVA